MNGRARKENIARNTMRDVYVLTDPGDDIDDHWALSLLLSMPSLRLRLVLCDSYNSLDRADVLAKFFKEANVSGVPVGIGSNRTGGKPLIMHGFASRGAVSSYDGPVHQDGVGALIQMAMAPSPPAEPRPALVVIAPCPSLREALRREPRIGSRFDVYAMGGSIYHGVNTSTPPEREWNILADPLSAQALYGAPWSINDAPLDTAGSAQVDMPAFGRLLHSPSRLPLVAALLAAYRYWLPRCPWPEATQQPLPANVSMRSSVIFDAVAVSMLPSFAAAQQHRGPFLDTETLRLRVTSDGWTRPVLDRRATPTEDAAVSTGTPTGSADHGRPVCCALKWRRKDEWQDAVVELLTSQKSVPG